MSKVISYSKTIEVIATATTNNSTSTLWSLTLPVDSSVAVRALIVGSRTDNVLTRGGDGAVVARRNLSGNSAIQYELKNFGPRGTNDPVDFDLNGNDLRIRVSSVNPATWRGVINYIFL